jgi:serine/threonine protein kinase
MSIFRRQLEVVLQQEIPINELTAKDIFPFWEDSDARLCRFGDEMKYLTVLDIVNRLEENNNLEYRLLLSIVLEGLSTWKEYEELSKDIDISDISELAKFDAEFRRYIDRKNNQKYEEDFEEIEDNTFSRDFTVSVQSIKPIKRDDTYASVYSTQEDLFFPANIFSIVKYLGKGGEGKVYLAEDTLHNDFVALKQYECSLSDGSSLLEILQKEVSMMKKICHTNIVKYFGLHMPDDSFEGMCVYNVVMEYVQGGSLADQLKKSGAFSISEIINVTKDILEALCYLHSKNIIHRDLKPSNVLGSDIYKISDFGICTQIKELESIPRSFVGTAWYMAPEVILQEPYSFSADIWSLSCLVYELYTGCKPFKTANLAKALHLMVECDSPIQDQTIPHPLLEDFLLKCWRRPHSFRPSAKELLDHPFLNLMS